VAELRLGDKSAQAGNSSRNVGTGAYNSPQEASNKIAIRNALRKGLIVSRKIEFITTAPR
jgi:hypothetical protein